MPGQFLQCPCRKEESQMLKTFDEFVAESDISKIKQYEYAKVPGLKEDMERIDALKLEKSGCKFRHNSGDSFYLAFTEAPTNHEIESILASIHTACKEYWMVKKGKVEVEHDNDRKAEYIQMLTCLKK